jgi:hypothetical protein
MIALMYVMKFTIQFIFEEYFTDKEQADLHEQFLNGEYDDFGKMPEY